MYARMHVFDGNGLKNYRMIYESNETHNDLLEKITKNIKIFEYVKGAKITGNASSNGTVQIKGQIITNHQRIYDYFQEAKANDKGFFELVVPYSQDSPYGTRLFKDYNLKYDNSSIFIEVSENDIMNGNIIKVN
jgi:dolichyl-diphosphooligosaccharide--protein glycosyltransferase